MYRIDWQLNKVSGNFYNKKNYNSRSLKLIKTSSIQFLVVFSFFEKKCLLLSYVMYVRPSVRLSVCSSVCPSVCPSVSIIYFRGNLISSRPIHQNRPKCPLRGGACQKGVNFRNSNCKLQIYAICNFLQMNLCARF